MPFACPTVPKVKSIAKSAEPLFVAIAISSTLKAVGMPLPSKLIAAVVAVGKSKSRTVKTD